MKTPFHLVARSRLWALLLGSSALGLLPQPAWPQSSAPAPAALASAIPAQTLHFRAYLDAVETHSLELAAQRQNIVSAEAGVGIAGIRPDPEFSFGRTRELVRAHNPRPVQYEPAVSVTLETGGKRKARIQAAHSQVSLARAEVESFLHGLYNDTAEAFAEACRSRDALVRKEQTLTALSNVVQANEVRRKAGDVGGVEFLQSRVERDQFEAEVIHARAEAGAARLALGLHLGRKFETVFGNAELDCAFAPFAHGEDLQALIAQALEKRDDILVARASLEHARDNASLAQANRWVDPTVSVGVTATRGYAATEAYEDTPRTRELALSVSIPIPFSRMNRGDILQAESEVTQAILELQQTELRTEAEVRAAHMLFNAARENVSRYKKNVLDDAQKVLDGMRLSYRNGASSLLELLAAQSSADEAYLAYLQAESDLAAATVKLQLSSGLKPEL